MLEDSLYSYSSFFTRLCPMLASLSSGGFSFFFSSEARKTGWIRKEGGDLSRRVFQDAGGAHATSEDRVAEGQGT